MDSKANPETGSVTEQSVKPKKKIDKAKVFLHMARQLMLFNFKNMWQALLDKEAESILRENTKFDSFLARVDSWWKVLGNRCTRLFNHLDTSGEGFVSCNEFRASKCVKNLNYILDFWPII